MTTVGNWRGYGSIVHDRVQYGQKVHSFREYIAAPQLTDERFQPALAIDPGEAADLAAFGANGWQLLDPQVVASTPADYRNFIQSSKAEIGIAKSGYVASRCGWFSDRSVCYLASGRPVLAQDTGFSDYLPTGTGLLAFSNMGELMNAIASLNRDYARHASAAREIAEQSFDSRRVLSSLMAKI